MVEVSGDVGNFTVTVKKNPRYIDMDKCIACGLCAQKCPRKVDDEFNIGL
ncbi:MAG: 4Fe-4S binding protein [Desulfobacterales bacterium]|nr:4Fe-4S binding protein [Desulfobacterales bacterium]